jgi:hypothetical protein
MDKSKTIWLGLLLEMACATAHAESCVTMLADVAGSVAIADAASAKPDEWWPVQLLQCLPARKVLSLQSGAHTTLFFPASGVALELQGKGRYEIMQDSARPLGNARAPERRALNGAFRDIQLDRAGLTPAGVRMRVPVQAAGTAPLGPRGIVLSREALLFRWEAAPGNPQYRFQLSKSRTEMIYETTTDRTELELPADVALAPGERYQWRVDIESPGPMNGRWQEFAMATAQARMLAAELDRALPAPSAAERNLREVLLMQQLVHQ